MTPLHLAILLHYHTVDDDYPLLENETRMRYANDLAKLGYLYTPQGRLFAITEHGKIIFEKILEYATELSE